MMPNALVDLTQLVWKRVIGDVEIYRLFNNTII